MKISEALSILHRREQELLVAGWNRDPHERVAAATIEEAALRWHRFAEAFPQQAEEICATLDVSSALTSKIDLT